MAEFPISPASMADARRVLTGVAHRTPLVRSHTISALTGSRVFLKCECLQKNGSYKLRGAYTLLSRLSPAERARGVVTFSAGNWAQGVAYAASALGTKAVIIVPETANPKKVAATRGYGAHVVQYGADSQAMAAKAAELQRDEGYVLITPLGGDDILAGTSTLGHEIVVDRPSIDVLVVPVGGGALIAGAAIGAKAMNPSVKVYGVQVAGANAVYRSLEAGRVVALPTVDTIADGLAVKQPDASTVALIRRYVDGIVLVSDDELRAAIYLLLERTKLLVEPAGAAAVAALLAGRLPATRGVETAAVLTGGNIDFRLLQSILESSDPAGAPPQGRSSSSFTPS